MRLRVYDIFCFAKAQYLLAALFIAVGEKNTPEKPFYLAANSSHRGRAGEHTKKTQPSLPTDLPAPSTKRRYYKNATSWGKTWAVVYQNGGRPPIPRLYLHTVLHTL
jgi:hypothetical protein